MMATIITVISASAATASAARSSPTATSRVVVSQSSVFAFPIMARAGAEANPQADHARAGHAKDWGHAPPTAAGYVLTAWLPNTETGWGSVVHIPNLSNWIMLFPVTAGARAIQIGIALGIISTSLKVLLGIDRSYLGGKEGGG